MEIEDRKCENCWWGEVISEYSSAPYYAHKLVCRRNPDSVEVMSSFPGCYYHDTYEEVRLRIENEKLVQQLNRGHALKELVAMEEGKEQLMEDARNLIDNHGQTIETLQNMEEKGSEKEKS